MGTNPRPPTHEFCTLTTTPDTHACIERCHRWSRTTSKGRAESTLTSAKTRNAGPKSTTIASKVGIRVEGRGGGSEAKI